MRIKIFSSNQLSEIEKKVNDFIKDKIVIDIKCTTTEHSHTVFVMYEDSKVTGKQYIAGVKEVEVNL